MLIRKGHFKEQNTALNAQDCKDIPQFAISQLQQQSHSQGTPCVPPAGGFAETAMGAATTPLLAPWMVIMLKCKAF